MMRLLSIFICLFMASSLWSADLSSSCKFHSVKDEISKSDNHLSFTNSGGLFNGGVCWWHSRFTRNALYLAQWKPELKKPNKDQAIKIIKKLRRGLGLVEVPGFKNLKEFSRDHEILIRKELERWQINDGAFKVKWVDGLMGTPSMPAHLMSEYMDLLYDVISRTDDLLFLRVQLQGVAAHAWLVKSMIPTADGYRFEVQDSNFLGMSSFDYKRGMTSLNYYGKKFIPYLQFTPELIKIKTLAKNSCR